MPAAATKASCGVVAGRELVGEDREEDLADQRHADGAADLLEGLQRARPGPGIARRHAGKHRLEQAREAKAETDAGDEERRQEPPVIDGVAEAGDDEVEPGDADDEEHAADADAGAEVGRAEPAGDQRGDEHAHRERRVGETRLERGEAEAGLEEQRDHHEERRECRTRRW